MDSTKFDAVARLFGGGMSRREALRSVLAGGAATAAGALGLASFAEDADATRRKKRKKNKDRCLHAGARCSSDRQCCPGKTKRICEVPVNGSNSDTYCCGGAGATCGAPNGDGDDTRPFCCVGYDCVAGPGGSYRCQPVPEE